jgi:lysophospholipase L1-like esterase
MRFQSDVIDLQPAVVHILAGTNDVYPGWTLCSNPTGAATATTPPTNDAFSYAPDTCSNMLYMVETAKRNNIKVVIGTIPPWGCDDNPECGFASADESPQRYDRITQLNNWLKAFAKSENIELVDYHCLLAAPDKLHYGLGMTADGVHPLPQGFTAITPFTIAGLRDTYWNVPHPPSLACDSQ